MLHGSGSLSSPIAVAFREQAPGGRLLSRDIREHLGVEARLYQKGTAYATKTAPESEER